MDKKKNLKSWLITLIALIDDIAIVAVIFLVLYFLDVDVPVPLLIVIILLVIAAIFLVHGAVIRVLRKRLVTGAEGMMGARGKTVEALDPSGMVDINGEYWKAVCRRGRIEKGRRIEVIGVNVNGLTLEVMEIESD